MKSAKLWQIRVKCKKEFFILYEIKAENDTDAVDKFLSKVEGDDGIVVKIKKNKHYIIESETNVEYDVKDVSEVTPD